MVCDDCKVAGDLNQRGLKLVASDREATDEFNLSHEWHDKCRGCDCQHTVGKMTVQRR